MKVIKFYKVNEKYGYLSNFSKHGFYLLGTYWKTSEHFFQAMKFKENETQLIIQQSSNPHEAAKLGRSLTPIREDWEKIKDSIMKMGVEEKFKQNSDICELLLNTDNALLIESTKNDSYWGDGGDGKGKNKLGKILMEVRSSLKEEINKFLLPPWEKYPDYETHSFEWSMGVMQSYLDDWFSWFRSLNPEHKHEYMKKYPAPSEWSKHYSSDSSTCPNKP